MFTETSVPKRDYIDLSKVPRQTLRLMLMEGQQELTRVAPAFKDEAAQRNGLTQVIAMCEYKGIL